MSWIDDVTRTRRHLAEGVAEARAAYDAAHAATLARLERDLAAGVAPAARAAARALAVTHPGVTEAHNPLSQRAGARWDDPAWADLTPSRAAVGVGGLVRIGAVEARRLGDGPVHEAPAIVPALCRGNLVFTSPSAQLDAANDALVAVAVRLLAAVEPGKLRLTAIDGAGLGASFRDLLHLHEKLRGPKVWHESGEVSGAVSDLTAHMSMVIQRWLRGEHASIDAYNRVAGEVAEPWRLLLVAGFPAGWRPEAAERLLGIAKNGPPLGVHVLLSLDTGAEMPLGFARDDLERLATVVSGGRDGWTLRERGRDPRPVLLDGRPPHALVEGLFGALNDRAARADDVRVPFSALGLGAPWTVSSADGLVAPLGRRGARERLELRLGEAGTSHHALVGGRTGSGKTGLLHALVQSLAWRYAPDELALYLVDFKEGVEFQVYRDLPHARVVAVQSERELGLSVLEGLRAELNRRGERFRARGLDDLAGWRRATGERMPRVVLIVDEFQVLFEHNDAVAHGSRVLLADLVSRGRSFGIHVVLASQTLAAMDLDARTLSQVGVRVALQMGEADSYKILGKDNDAARLLTRPGEAVYNDAGGAPGHNVRFQAAWLMREEREQRVAALAQRDPRRPLVFDGNRPADLAAHLAFGALLRAPAPNPAPVAWLGEPTTLDPALATLRFRRQARAHLLVVGTDEAAAARIALVVGVAAHLQGARVRLADLAAADAPGRDALDLLARVAPAEPVAPLIAEVSAELSARRDARADGAAAAPPWIVVLHGLPRARGLERQGLKPSVAGAQLAQVLAEGAELGLHVVMWGDTLAGLGRVLASADLHELAARLALGASEASRVLGTPTAPPTVRPGVALLTTDDEPERIRKVRLFGPAPWLAEVLR